MKTRLKLFAEIIENLFYPDKVIITGGIVVILLFINSILTLNNIITLFASLFVYVISGKIIEKIIKNEDKIHLSSAIISTIIFFIFMNFLEVSSALKFGAASLFLNLIMLFIIRTFWKISAHTSVYTNFSTIMSLINPNFIITFVFLPLVVWSRIKLKRHTYPQVLVACIFGFILPLLIYNWLFIVA